MKAITLVYLLLACAAFGRTFHGVARTESKGLFDTVEITLIYDADGRSKISLRWSQKGSFQDFDFVITRKPAKEYALTGYFEFEGCPVVVRVDTFDKDKRFYLYHSVIRPDAVFVGTYE